MCVYFMCLCILGNTADDSSGGEPTVELVKEGKGWAVGHKTVINTNVKCLSSLHALVCL